MVTVGVLATNGLNRATGYGKLELGIAGGLREMGVRTALAMPPIVPLADVTILVGAPVWGDKLKMRRPAWCYTMSETTRCSPMWTEALHRNFDGVFVPCPGLVEVYQNSGVEIPVVYAPMGVTPHPYPLPKHGERETQGRVANRPYTFLTYSLGDMRKGSDRALLAFNLLFRGDGRYRMIIKARDNWNNSWLTGCDDPQITVVGGETDETDWWRLLNEVDCFVFPSRGEGFGLPPREATLAGVPTIATQWLGMWDVDQWGLPIPVMEMRPAYFDDWEANDEGSLWAEPDWEELRKQMAWVAQKPGIARGIARNGYEYLQTNFTWRKCAETIMEVMKHGEKA